MLDRAHMRSLALLALALGGCQALPHTVVELPVPHATRDTAIARGLEYLANTQVTADYERRTGRNWEGNWPLSMRPQVFFGAIKVISIGSGLPAYVHGSLDVMREEHAAALGLTKADLVRVRVMRSRAMRCMERFRQHAGEPTPYGWAPLRTQPPHGFARVLADLLQAQMVGPAMHGDRAPAAVPGFPVALQSVADVDDTAVVLGARRSHAARDGGPPPPRAIGSLFAPWRDLAGVRRGFPRWLEPGSGAFLTWMMPSEPWRAANDVDLAINANVLWVLGRYGELDTEGVDDAVALIVRAARERRFACPGGVSRWYPERVFHYAVARAWACGPVPALAPAVDILADDLVATARRHRDGSVSWGRLEPGENALNTALAVLALLHAGRAPELVRAGCRRLRHLQDRRTGGWDEAVLTWFRSSSGIRILFRGAATPTAFAVEALARARLAETRVGAASSDLRSADGQASAQRAVVLPTSQASSASSKMAWPKAARRGLTVPVDSTGQESSLPAARALGPGSRGCPCRSRGCVSSHGRSPADMETWALYRRAVRSYPRSLRSAAQGSTGSSQWR